LTTPLGPLEGARNAVIAKIIADLGTETERITAIQQLDERLDALELPVEIPRVAPDGWMRTEDITDIAAAVQTNLTYVATLADLLRAAGYLSQVLIDTRAKAADAAADTAVGFIEDLGVYLSARKGGGDAIVVAPEDLKGDYSLTGRTIMPRVASASNVTLAMEDVITNGRKGNMLEVSSETQAGVELDEVKFVDPNDTRRTILNVNDDNDETVLEVEATSIHDEQWLEMDVYGYTGGKRVQLNWNSAPSDNRLVAEVTAKVVGGKLSSLSVVPDLSITEKVLIESVEYSKNDGMKWYVANGPKGIARGTGAYDTGTAGEGVWTIPGGRADRVKIRLVQDTPYRTKLATVEYSEHGKKTPLLSGPPYLNTTSKSEFFTPESLTYGSVKLDKRVIARAADRWAISIKEINAHASEYERSCVLTTKTYQLPAECSRVGISSTETVPSGATINYEISHDGVTWTKISPVERSSGKEIVVFSAGGAADPESDPGAVYVKTVTPVKAISLRITMTCRGTDAPSISKLSIHPILKR
jgi:hypothetical protein